MAAEPEIPPPAPSAALVLRGAAMQVLAALAIQVLCLQLTGAWIYHRTLGRLHPLTRLMDDAHRHEAAAAAVQAGLLQCVATLGPVMLLVLVLLRLLRYRDPIEGLGFGGGGRGAAHLLAGFAAGVLAHAGLLMVLAVLSAQGALPAWRAAWLALLQIGHNAGAVANHQPGFLITLTVLMALAYSAGRLVVSHAHVASVLAEVASPGIAAVAAALAFAATYLTSSLLTPLAFVNLFLFGLLLAQQRLETGLSWGPLGLLAGWVVIGLWSGEPHQGLPVPVDASSLTALPGFLSGGVWGHEGGLGLTILLLGWLAIRLRPRPVNAEPAPAA